MKHPLINTLVTGRFDDAHRVARVTNVTFPRRGSRAPLVTVRTHTSTALVDGTSWAAILSRYTGPSATVPVTSIKCVLPGDGEGWINATEYLEWAEK